MAFCFLRTQCVSLPPGARASRPLWKLINEQFAAQLYGTANALFDCDYVGVQTMAKGYGQCRMNSLRPKVL